MNNRRTLGFTLIEILFVIAILSVIASFGISMLQKRAQQTKVEKTALQVQQIFQAALAWHADKNEWPYYTTEGETKTVKDACVKTDDAPSVEFIGKYLPIQEISADNKLINAWGLAYSNCMPPGTAPKPSDPKFQVEVGLPSAQVAAQVAALLPNAIVKKDTSIVHAEITASFGGGGASDAPVQIVNIGSKLLQNTDFVGGVAVPEQIFGSFSCPNNMTGGMLFLPQKIATGDFASKRYAGTSQSIKDLEFEPIPVGSSGCSLSASDHQYHCRFNVYFVARSPNEYHTVNATQNEYDGSAPGALGFSYVMYCKK